MYSSKKEEFISSRMAPGFTLLKIKWYLMVSELNSRVKERRKMSLKMDVKI